MNLTIYELNNMIDSCDNFSKILKDVMKINYPDKSDTPFISAAHYEFAKEDVKVNPENYYKVQIFDRMCYIIFDRSSKVYHIVTKGFYPENLPKKYPLYRNTKYSFIISDDFNIVKEVFQIVVIDCINSLVAQNELF